MIVIFFLIYLVDWAIWVTLGGHPGFEFTRLVFQTRRLIRHEYGLVFYLGEGVIRQHSPYAELLTSAFPSTTMPRTGDTSEVDRVALRVGVHYSHFVAAIRYPKFAAAYLLVEAPGDTPQALYDPYTAF